MGVKVLKSVAAREFDAGNLGSFGAQDLEGPKVLKHCEAALTDIQGPLSLREVINGLVANRMRRLGMGGEIQLMQPTAGLIARAFEIDLAQASRVVEAYRDGEDLGLFGLEDEKDTEGVHELDKLLTKLDGKVSLRILELLDFGDSGMRSAAKAAKVEPFSFTAPSEPVVHDDEALQQALLGYANAYRVMRDNRARSGSSVDMSKKLRRDWEGRRTFGQLRAASGREEAMGTIVSGIKNVVTLVRSVADGAFLTEIKKQTELRLMSSGGLFRAGRQ